MSGARSIKAGRAFVELFADKEGFERDLKTAERTVRQFGASIASIGKKFAAIGASVALAFVPAIKAASDMEETMNKFNVVFGSSAEAVKQWGDEFGATVGRSKQQIADFMAGSQDLFVPLGFDRDRATDLSKQITGLAIDLASFNNMADADVLRDLQAALTGSGQVMKKYGVIVSDATMKQEALRQGWNPQELTEQQKVQARLNLIMAGTTDAQGDATRSAGSYENQMKALKAAVDDTQVAIGEALLPAVTEIITRVAEVAGKVQEWAKENQQTIQSIVKLAGGVGAAGVALMAFGQVANGVAAAIKAVRVVALMSTASLTAFGVAAGAIVAIGLAVWFSQNTGEVRKFNEALKDSIRLTEELHKLHDKRAERMFAEAAAIADPEERKAFLEQELERANKDLVGLQASLNGARKNVEALDTTFNRMTGNKILAGAEHELNEVEDQLRRQKDLVARIREEIGKTEAADAPSAPEAPAAPDEFSEAMDDVARATQAFADSVKRELQTPLDAFDEFTRQLDDAFEQGLLTAEEFDRAFIEAQQRLAEAEQRMSDEERQQREQEIREKLEPELRTAELDDDLSSQIRALEKGITEALEGGLNELAAELAGQKHEILTQTADAMEASIEQTIERGERLATFSAQEAAFGLAGRQQQTVEDQQLRELERLRRDQQAANRLLRKILDEFMG